MASAMTLTYPHTFSPTEAKDRLTAMGDYLGKKHGIHFSWQGDDKATFAGKVMAISIDGSVAIRASEIELVGSDPGFLLRKKAEQYLRHKLETYLNPATAVDALPKA